MDGVGSSSSSPHGRYDCCWTCNNIPSGIDVWNRCFHSLRMCNGLADIASLGDRSSWDDTTYHCFALKGLDWWLWGAHTQGFRFASRPAYDIASAMGSVLTRTSPPLFGLSSSGRQRQRFACSERIYPLWRRGRLHPYWAYCLTNINLTTSIFGSLYFDKSGCATVFFPMHTCFTANSSLIVYSSSSLYQAYIKSI